MANSDPNLPVAAKLGVKTVLFARDDTPRVLEELRRRPKVQVTELEDGGAIIVIKPNPRDMTLMLLTMIVVSGLLALAALAMDRDWLSLEFRFDTIKMYVVAGMGGLGAMITILVRIASGPPKETKIEVHPGRIKFDHYVCGDHVVKDCRADEIMRIDDSVGLDFHLRNSTITIAPFASSQTLRLISQLVRLTLFRK